MSGTKQNGKRRAPTFARNGEPLLPNEQFTLSICRDIIAAETLDEARSHAKRGRDQFLGDPMFAGRREAGRALSDAIGWRSDRVVPELQELQTAARKILSRSGLLHLLVVKDDPEESADAAADIALPYVDLAAPLTDRQWLIKDRVPLVNVSLLSGEGAAGKSILLLQLSAAVVLGKDWLGTLPDKGPVLYIGAEDDDGEINRRLDEVALHYGATRQDLIDAGLRVLSFAGHDAILGQPDRDGIIRPTPLFDQIKRDAVALRPKLIVVDTVADSFAGKEIDRAHVRQFVGIMRALAMKAGSAVILASHPSVSGIASSTGLSGSTAWHNSVRARMYFKAAPGDDADLRVLEHRKSNYSAVAAEILLRWKNGVYVVEPRQSLLQSLAAEAVVDDLFVKLLRRLADEDRTVSHQKGPTYAPSAFADQPEAIAGKITSKAFAASMQRLFVAKRIRIVAEGPQSRRRSRLVEGGSDDSNRLPTAFQPAEKPFQPPSNHLSTHTPRTPPPVGREEGRLEDHSPSNRRNKREKSRDA